MQLSPIKRLNEWMNEWACCAGQKVRNDTLAWHSFHWSWWMNGGNKGRKEKKEQSRGRARLEMMYKWWLMTVETIWNWNTAQRKMEGWGQGSWWRSSPVGWWLSRTIPEDSPPNACFITKSMLALLPTVDLKLRDKWACSHWVWKLRSSSRCSHLSFWTWETKGQNRIE